MHRPHAVSLMTVSAIPHLFKRRAEVVQGYALVVLVAGLAVDRGGFLVRRDGLVEPQAWHRALPRLLRAMPSPCRSPVPREITAADELEKKDGRLRRYTIGHESGHWEPHSDDARSGMISLLAGKRTWCRTGSAHPAERQAERFSASLLMSRDDLLAAVPSRPWRGWPVVYRLADMFLVNVTPMKIRPETLGWMHLDDNGTPVSGPVSTTGQSTLFDV
jgi:hypothetical protein